MNSEAIARPAKARLRVLLPVLLPALLIGSILSGAIHEWGHALMARGCGARITQIQPFWFLGPPHVSFTGKLSASEKAWIDGAGVGAVVVVALLGLALIPFARLSTKAAVLWAVILAMLFTQTLAWCVLPWVVLAGGKPQDDVVKFLQHSGVHPVIVSAVAGAVLLGCVGLFLRRTRFLGRLRELKGQALGRL